MINRFEATVERVEPGGLAWLRLRRGRLAAASWPGLRAGARLRVAVDPDDVVLCEGHPGRTSARNVLPGHVASLRRTPEGVFVTLQVGFPLTARVTHRAAAELGLKRGSSLFALVKATSVRPDVEVTAPFRVCLGLLDPERIDLLRAIGRTGSLTAAAKERGIHYRTAWVQARAMNRRWGTPLVARAAGGRGGGGSALTPEGRAVVRRADRLERYSAASRSPASR